MRNYTAKLDASQTMFNNKLKIDFGMFASKVDKRYLNDYQKTFYSAASFNPTFPDFLMRMAHGLKIQVLMKHRIHWED